MTPSKDELVFRRSDLEAAVAKGVLDRPSADGLAEFLIQSHKEVASDPDEERLRLITGFNDIFVTIGIALFLGALNYLLSSYGALAAAQALPLRRGVLPKFSPRESAWRCQALSCSLFSWCPAPG